MTIKTATPAFVPSLSNLFADMAKYGCVFEESETPPEPTGVAAAVAAKAAKDAADAKAAKDAADAAAAAAKSGPSEAEKAAKAEAAALKKQLADLQGVSPEEIKELRAAKAAADKAREEAAAAKKKAEEEKLKNAGDFEALKARMAEEHAKEQEKLQAQIAELTAGKDALSGSLVELNIGAAFSGSKFLADETIYTTAKARKIYGDHVDLVDGKVVVFDAPRGEEKRTPYVDAQGRTLSFDEAMKRVVEADPDRDMILKTKLKSGSGTAPSGLRQPSLRGDSMTGTERIKAGLGALLGTAR